MLMHQTEIRALADEAANHAVAFIQQRLNIPTGDLAGLYFSGPAWGALVEVLEGYISAEIQFNQPEGSKQ